jgi:hypothetical protein
MMMPVIGHPARGRSAAIEHGAENQEMLDNPIELERAMREKPMIANRGAESAERRNAQGDQKHLQARHRIQNHADNRQNVDQYEVRQNAQFAFRRFPKWLFPRTNYTKGGLIHKASNKMIACSPDSSKPLRRREIPAQLYTSCGRKASTHPAPPHIVLRLH